MQIDKPSWLRNWLDTLNWDILTWKVYVGDAIESGIDWLLYYVNSGLSLADNAYDWAVYAWNEAVDFYNELSNTINIEVTKLTNKIGQVWSDIVEWGEGVKGDIEDWVDASLHSLSEKVSQVNEYMNQWQATWDTFLHVTLPSLVTFDWWSSFWQGAYSNIEEWWSIQHDRITQEVDIKVDPLKEEIYQHKSWLDMIKLLFTDPEEFVTDLLARIW